MIMMMGADSLTPPLQVVICVWPQTHPSPVTVIICKIPWAPSPKKKKFKSQSEYPHGHAHPQDFRNTSPMMARFGGKPLAIERMAPTQAEEPALTRPRKKVIRMYRKAVSVERELDSLDGVAWHAPETCPTAWHQKRLLFYSRLG